MSKQSEAKLAQGYTKLSPQCINCKNYESETTTRAGWNQTYEIETNLRCVIGGFAINKTAWCKLWEPK